MPDVLRLLIAEDIAEALQISVYHAYELLRRGAIPVVKIGRLRRVRPEDLAAFIAARTNGEKS